MPDNPTDCGEPVALSTILRLPVSSVVSSIGVKTTETLHFLPGASVLSHCDLTVKTDGDAVSISTLTAAPTFFLPLFLIVTLLALLGFPTAVLLPKFSDEGLIESAPRGVAVAVGVAVGLRVPVAVAVAVGVATLDPVAVAVALGDGVGEAGGGWRATNRGSASSVNGPLIVDMGDSLIVPVLLPTG